MDKSTFKTRLISLLQKSRQASKLYSELLNAQEHPFHSNTLSYSKLQIVEWKNVNLELVAELETLLNDFYDQKTLISKSFKLYEKFKTEHVYELNNFNDKKSELLKAARNDDFAKSTKISLELVSLKSRNQALNAVLKELDKMLKLSKADSTKIDKNIENALEDNFKDNLENNLENKIEKKVVSKAASKNFMQDKNNNLNKVISINVSKKIQVL